MKTEFFVNGFACYWRGMVTYGSTRGNAEARMIARCGGKL